jgi:two-component system, sensor histidine kinase and response regulator
MTASQCATACLRVENVQERVRVAPLVLIVEDDIDQLHGLMLGLKAAGFDVMAATEAGYGTVLARAKPDVIILDIGLPDADGHTVASCLRMHDETAAIPIMYMSARSGHADLDRARELGIDAYLVKPCCTQDVVTAINKVLLQKE